jgi:glycosyltransferase involved in cell wall biosynthesis
LRIGIDAQYLATGSPSGHYYFLLELLRGFRKLEVPEKIDIFYKHTAQWREDGARVRSRVGDLGFPIRKHRVPRRLARLRRRFGAIHRVDLFLYLAETAFPPGEGRCNAFVLADVIPLKLPDCVPDWAVKIWSDYYEMARRHGDIFLTFSEHASDDIAETLGIPRDRLRSVPLATGRQFRPIADRAMIAGTLAQWGLEPGNYILSVGALEPRKNQTLILEAYERLRSRRQLPRGCKLVLSGSRGWKYEPLLERIESLGLGEDVVLLGHADPLEYLYNGAIVKIFPSLMEGFGLPPLEAMSCGTPVITSNTSSLPEVVGDAGILIDPRDVDGLVEAMRRVLGDPALREQMRSRGLARAAGFTWERTASGYLDALRTGYLSYRQNHR